MNSRGSILVTTLWIVSILAVLAVSVAAVGSMELRVAKHAEDSMRAGYLARGAVVKAISAIANTDIPVRKDGGPLGGGSFSYEISDEEGRFNIRTDKTALNNIQRYRDILKGLSDKLNDDVISAIIDWQDPDSIVSAGGAENIYYANMERPYNCKNAPLACAEELLLVKGMTPQIFNEIKDHVTVYGEGRVNINTASEKVLNAVINEGGNYEGLVKRIIDYRKGPDMKEGTPDDRHLLNLAEDFNEKITPTAAETIRLTALSDLLSCESGNFRITAAGACGGIARTVTYVTKDPAEYNAFAGIRYYHEE